MKTFEAYIENPVSLEESMKSILGVGAAAMLSLSPTKTYYHGTQQSFDGFSDVNGNANAYGKGFYFTDKLELAKKYANGEDQGRIVLNTGTANRVITVHLKILNPFYMDRSLVSNDKIKTIESISGIEFGPFDSAFQPHGHTIWSKLVFDAPTHKLKADYASSVLQASGYDAIIAPTETVVFKPEQIVKTGEV